MDHQEIYTINRNKTIMCSIKPWKIKSPGAKPLLRAEGTKYNCDCSYAKEGFVSTVFLDHECHLAYVARTIDAVGQRGRALPFRWLMSEVLEWKEPSFCWSPSPGAHWYQPHVSGPPVESGILSRSQMETRHRRSRFLVITKFNICKDVRVLWTASPKISYVEVLTPQCLRNWSYLEIESS